MCHPEDVHAGPLVESGLLVVVKLVLHHFSLAPAGLLVEATWAATNFPTVSQHSALLVRHESAVHRDTWGTELARLQAGLPSGPFLMPWVEAFLQHTRESAAEWWRIFENVLWCTAN